MSEELEENMDEHLDDQASNKDLEQQTIDKHVRREGNLNEVS